MTRPPRTAATPVSSKLLEGQPILLCDIGARGGAHPRWGRYLHLLEFAGFEPEASECARLNEETDGAALRRRFLPYALSNADGTRRFFVCRDPGCSSLLQPNTPFVSAFHYGPEMAVAKTLDLEVTTLGTACVREGLRPDVLKLDTQGAELDILAGAGQALDSTLILESEVEFNPQYVNQPLFGDIDRFLRDRGFLLLGLRRTLWRRTSSIDPRASAAGATIMHGDALYWNERLFSSEKAWRPRDVAAAAVTLAAYRQNDFLLQFLKMPAPAASGVTADDRDGLLDELLERPPRGLGLLSPVLSRLSHRSFRRMIDSLRDRRATDWHDPDFF